MLVKGAPERHTAFSMGIHLRIHLLHKSHKTPCPYPAMHHSYMGYGRYIMGSWDLSWVYLLLKSHTRSGFDVIKFLIGVPHTHHRIHGCQLGVSLRTELCGSVSNLINFPLNKMGAISQMTDSNAFSWIKSFVFWSQLHWSMFLNIQLTTSECWSM